MLLRDRETTADTVRRGRRSKLTARGFPAIAGCSFLLLALPFPLFPSPCLSLNRSGQLIRAPGTSLANAISLVTHRAAVLGEVQVRRANTRRLSPSSFISASSCCRTTESAVPDGLPSSSFPRERCREFPATSRQTDSITLASTFRGDRRVDLFLRSRESESEAERSHWFRRWPDRGVIT